MRIDKIYHFIGIGGVSMNGLAMLLLNKGCIVQGSDSTRNQFTLKVEQAGATVFLKHKASNVENATTVVFTDAIKPDNPEFLRAKELGLQIFSRAEMLEYISQEYESVIAISGSHGKTTTTGMLTEVFLLAGLKPTAHIGGILKKNQSNIVLGDKKFFITEACEFKSNFLHLKPALGVILNVEAEHLDYFKTYEKVVEEFEKFAKNCKTLVKYEKVPISHNNQILYGARGYNARKIKQIKNGKYQFDCWFENKKLFRVRLNSVGKHNIYNALATIAVAKYFGISDKVIVKGLGNFGGILRRYEIIKQKPFIVNDYAHHPSEISSTIKATSTFRAGKIIAVFQPHTYTRTESFMKEFETAFDLADEIVIIKTYSAREKYKATGSARALFKMLEKRHKKIKYFNSLTEAHSYLSVHARKKDTILILGAGNIDKLARMF